MLDKTVIDWQFIVWLSHCKTRWVVCQNDFWLKLWNYDCCFEKVLKEFNDLYIVCSPLSMESCAAMSVMVMTTTGVGSTGMGGRARPWSACSSLWMARPVHRRAVYSQQKGMRTFEAEVTKNVKKLKSLRGHPLGIALGKKTITAQLHEAACVPIVLLSIDIKWPP